MENCSIGLIAGPASVATSPNPRLRPPVGGFAPPGARPREASALPRTRAPHPFIRRFRARQGRISRQDPRLWAKSAGSRSRRPAATPRKKKTIRESGFVPRSRSSPQPMPAPTMMAEMNSLPARMASDMPESPLGAAARPPTGGPIRLAGPARFGERAPKPARRSSSSSAICALAFALAGLSRNRASMSTSPVQVRALSIGENAPCRPAPPANRAEPRASRRSRWSRGRGRPRWRPPPRRRDPTARSRTAGRCASPFAESRQRLGERERAGERFAVLGQFVDEADAERLLGADRPGRSGSVRAPGRGRRCAAGGSCRGRSAARRSGG